MTKKQAALGVGLYETAERVGPAEAQAVDALLMCPHGGADAPYWLTVPEFVERYVRVEPERYDGFLVASVAWDQAIEALDRGEFDRCLKGATDALRFAAFMATGVPS